MAFKSEVCVEYYAEVADVRGGRLFCEWRVLFWFLGGDGFGGDVKLNAISITAEMKVVMTDDVPEREEIEDEEDQALNLEGYRGNGW